MLCVFLPLYRKLVAAWVFLIVFPTSSDQHHQFLCIFFTFKKSYIYYNGFFLSFDISANWNAKYIVTIWEMYPPMTTSALVQFSLVFYICFFSSNLDCIQGINYIHIIIFNQSVHSPWSNPLTLANAMLYCLSYRNTLTFTWKN